MLEPLVRYHLETKWLLTYALNTLDSSQPPVPSVLPALLERLHLSTQPPEVRRTISRI